MPEVIPPPAIVAARSVSAFISANSDIDEVLAPLARVPTPARFQTLVGMPGTAHSTRPTYA
jgi:hypothetical protein